MAFLIDIGVGILTKLAEYTVEPAIRQVGYIICYNKNLQKLQDQAGELVEAGESIRHAVAEEERKGKKIETGVQKWLTEVNQLTNKANGLKDEHHAQTKCLCGFCPNIKLRHRLSRKSTKMVQEVAELFEKKKNFDRIGYVVPPEPVCLAATQGYEAYDSRTSIAKDVINELGNSNTYMIGVYGIGGVGKTTLVKEVYKQLATGGENLFDEVVMVLDLKKNPSIDRIQNEIAEQLGLEFHETKTEAGRAREICNRIKAKKTLVILDDVWEKIDLEDVGLPRMETLKMLLTSRSKQVLSSDMGTQKEFPLDLLDKDESWSLFQKTAGGIVENPDVGTIATKVADKCGGLPLLIVTVARSLKNSPLHAWKDTFRRLKRWDGKGLAEKTYSAIEWSYNKLDNEELKSLFLLCGNVVSDANTLGISDLWKHSIGLGLLKDTDTIGEAWDALCSMIEQLKDSCLLLAIESDDHKRVRMHDLVKDVAKRIASRDQHVLSLSSGSELKEWPDKDFCSKCTMISLIKCKILKLPEVLVCPELTMFHLNSITDDSSRHIPSNFFGETMKLRVLDLTCLNIPFLPSSLVFLESLRTLCLDQCTLADVAMIGQLHSLEILSFLQSKLKELPKEIGQLRRLRLLDLKDCSELRVISPNVLSSLKRLEHLRMRNSFNRWEAGGLNATTRSNASLEELKQLPQLTALQIHIPDANILPPDLFTESKLEKFQICIGSVWKWDDVDETMNALKLHTTAGNQFDQGLKMLLHKTEDLYLEGTQGVHSSIVSQVGVEGLQKLKHLHFQNNVELTNFKHIINKKVAFPSLTWLEVGGLDDLRFLLSCSTARSLAQLKRLQISKCQIMEAIVSTEETDESAEKLFPQLQDLELKDIPMLTQFCSGNNSGLSFERLRLEECAKRDTICEDTEEMDSTGNLDIVVPHFLFNNKTDLLNLKKLFIDGLPELTTLWNNQESSKNLETIEILSCHNLKSIFPASIARSLQQLRGLEVENCGVLEEIVSKEDGVETIPMFVFPALTYMRLLNLPRLQSFYPGLHSSKWPSLLYLGVKDCDKLMTFEVSKPEWNKAYVCTPIKRSLFLLDKDSFPSIEVLGFDIMENWDSQTLHYFKKLRHLRIYEKNEHTNSPVNSFEKLFGLENGNEEIHPVVGDRSLPLLRELFLHRMKSLMNIGDDSFRPAGSYIPNLETLELEDCDSLKNLRSSAISFKTLRTLKVSCCKGMKYLLDLSMAGSLMQLTKLKVAKCEEMVDIITSDGNGDPRDNEVKFSVLKHLELFDLPSLRSFCSGAGILKFPSLENLSMRNCARLETFILDSMDESNTIGKNIKDTDSTENHEAGVVRHFLFDNKVELPSLKSLSLKGLTKLASIWHSQLSLNSFSRLKDLEVHGCGNLLNIFVPSTMGRLNALETLLIAKCKSLQVVFELGVTDVRGIQGAAQQRYFDCGHLSSVEIMTCEGLQNIFPASVARNLQQLKSLLVRSSGVEEIVTKQEESMETTPKFVFPKVTQVYFYNLPQLTNFYRGMHLSSWPSLHEMWVLKCSKVNIFVEEISNFQGPINMEHPCALIPPSLFIIDKDSFPNLEILSVNAMEFSNNGQLPGAAELFCKLKFLYVCCPQSKSVVFLDKLLDTEVEGGNTGGDSSNAVFRSGTHTQQQRQLHHLNELRLIRMEKLMHLGQQDDEDEEDNSESATRIIPNLQILDVFGCHSLRNLRSSTISFDNLTTLRVWDGDALQYLITYSTAKSLMQLTELEVKTCPRLVEIVGIGNEEGDSRKEITFRRLKHLKLSYLPRFQGFCSSRNCIAKFPSLETLTMSKRLKLMVFSAQQDQMLQLTNQEEEVDTDVDVDDSEEVDTDVDVDDSEEVDTEEELNSEDEMESAST